MRWIYDLALQRCFCGLSCSSCTGTPQGTTELSHAVEMGGWWLGTGRGRPELHPPKAREEERAKPPKFLFHAFSKCLSPSSWKWERCTTSVMKALTCLIASLGNHTHQLDRVHHKRVMSLQGMTASCPLVRTALFLWDWMFSSWENECLHFLLMFYNIDRTGNRCKIIAGVKSHYEDLHGFNDYVRV